MRILPASDAWAEKARVDDQMIGNKQTFPSGMKALGDYLHDKGKGKLHNSS